MAMYDNLLANVPTDLWIGGQWRKSSDGARFDVIDQPRNSSPVASASSRSKRRSTRARATPPGQARKARARRDFGQAFE